MQMTDTKQKFKLLPYDIERVKILCGVCNENIDKIEKFFKVKVKNRDNIFSITGETESVIKASSTVHDIYDKTANNQNLSSEEISELLFKH